MTDRIDATGLSEQDGDRLRDLLARFAERARETEEVYEQGRGDRVDPGLLAIRRVRWKAWTAAYDLMVRSFHWSTVPSMVPATTGGRTTPRQLSGTISERGPAGVTRCCEPRT